MKVDVYQNLLLINSAFDQVVRSLVALAPSAISEHRHLVNAAHENQW